LLRSVGWFVTNLSELLIGLIFKGQDAQDPDGIDTLSLNVSNKPTYAA
jgi:hypothetical protein